MGATSYPPFVAVPYFRESSFLEPGFEKTSFDTLIYDTARPRNELHGPLPASTAEAPSTPRRSVGTPRPAHPGSIFLAGRCAPHPIVTRTRCAETGARRASHESKRLRFPAPPSDRLLADQRAPTRNKPPELLLSVVEDQQLVGAGGAHAREDGLDLGERALVELLDHLEELRE